MDVPPSFYTKEGEAFAGDTFHMQPTEVKTVDLKTIMPAVVRNRHDMGGMTLSYYGGALEMWGQLRLMNVQHGNSVDVTFVIEQDKRSEIRNAVWPMPEHAEAILALGNFSSATVTATLTFSNSDVEEVTIPAFGTNLVRKQTSQFQSSTYAGVRVDAHGSTALIATGAVTTNDGSFTSSIRFYDTKNVVQPNLYATNFRLRDSTPSMVLRNTGTQSIAVIPRFIPAPGDPNNFIDLPSTTLEPDEIKNIDIASFKAAVSGRSEFDRVSIQVLNSGPNGSLIGALNGVDEITGMTYDVPLRDIGAMRNSTGAYPWRLDHDVRTVVSITNIAAAPSGVYVQINYPGGPYVLDPKHMAAGETLVFDLRKIRDEQVPDRNGHTIPLSVNGGQFKWSIHGPGSGRLIGRAEMLSSSQEVSSSYSCPGGNCPMMFSYAFLDPSDITLAPLDEVTVNALEVDCDAAGCTLPFSPWVTGWHNDDPLVAALVGNGSSADVIGAGIDEGTTGISADIGYEQYYWDGQNCYDGGQSTGSASGQATVPGVDIKLNGDTVSGQTKTVIVGQKMNLTTSVIPSGGTVTESSWTVPGDTDRIANYVVVPPPQNGFSPTSATVTPLTTLTDTQVNFYWITAGSRTVQYSCKVNGTMVHQQVTFNVQRPTAQITIATAASNSTQGTNIGVDSQTGSTDLRLGTPDGTPGLTFTQTVSTPSGFNGSYQWVQVFTKRSASATDFNANVSSFNFSGLDDKYPYPLDAGANSTNHKASDSPGGPIDGFVDASVDYEATMWLMFRPTAGTNPIWVPLRQVSWIWKAEATFDGSNWTISPSPTDPKNLTDSDSTTHPQWTKNATTGT